MSEETQAGTPAEIEHRLGSLLKLSQDLVQEKKELDAYSKERIEKIAKDSAEALQASNDIGLAKEKEAERLKAIEEKQLAFERELSRGTLGSKEKGVSPSLNHKQRSIVNGYLKAEDLSTQNSFASDINLINEKNKRDTLKGFYPHLSDEKLQSLQSKYWVEGDDTRGGYFVTPEISSQFIKRDQLSTSIRNWCNVVPMRNSAMLINIDDDINIEALWGGELERIDPQETARIGQSRLIAKKMLTNVGISDEELEDAYIDMESFIMEKLMRRFTRTENKGIFNGTGAKEIKGIYEYLDWSAPGVYTRDAIERVQTEVAATIGYNDLVNMNTALTGDYQQNAVWFIAREAWGAIQKIKTLDGLPILNRNNGMRDGFDFTLFSHPVVIVDQMPNGLGSASQPVMLGDYKRALTIGDRLVTRISRDDITDNAVVKFIGKRRVGFLLTSFDGMKIMQVS